MNPTQPSLPAEAFAAVSTNRTEFLQSLRARIERGEALSLSDALGLIDLVEQSILWQAHFAATMGEMTHLGNKVRDFARGMEKIRDEIDELSERAAEMPPYGDS